MKFLSLAILLQLAASAAFSQNPTHGQKLYYTCKVWGVVKYFHSRVSTCEVQWDDILLRTAPSIQRAVTADEFNDALDTLLAAAGPMSAAGTASPDTLPAGLTRNRNFCWFDDPLLRADIRAKLHFIADNFRPHPICWTVNNDGSGAGYGFLRFAFDDPCLKVDASTQFPDEAARVLLLAKYWNIMQYFNLNLFLTDVPWDSTLAREAALFVTARDYASWYASFKRMTASLSDAHVEGMTSSAVYPRPAFSPKVILRHIQGGYHAVKSGYPELFPGDRITAIDGRSMEWWEDSLRPFISSGNAAVFRRDLIDHLIPGESGSSLPLQFVDRDGATRTLTVRRESSVTNTWFSRYHPSDSLSSVSWRKWGCNVGYVHMGNLQVADVAAMYRDLHSTRAIIFDVRNYPQGSAWSIANLMYPRELPFCLISKPDVQYPGTCFQQINSGGSDAVANPYKGAVIILCNEQTQSHAEYTCMILRAMPGAVVVGSQTAGADGNITGFSPTKETWTGFTTLGVYYPDGSRTQRIGIVPDSVVVPSAEGIRSGRDEVLEKALEIAGCPVTTDTPALPRPVPGQFPAVSAFPNPFTEAVTITLSRPVDGGYALEAYDLLGRKVVDLTKRLQDRAGIILLRRDLPAPGLYVLLLRNGQESQAISIFLR